MKKLSIIIVIILLIAAGAFYFVRSIGNSIGGGGTEQSAPESVKTGSPAAVGLIVTATGGGGPIKGRYTNIILGYRLAGENEYKTIQPRLIELPDNFKNVQSKTFQSEAYEFIIPPYQKGTKGEIEYYVEETFDGYPGRQEGIHTITLTE